MPCVTSIERLAHEEGRVDALQEGIVMLLELKFKSAGAKLARKVRALRDAERLQSLLQTVAGAKTLDEVRALLS
jgi:hypothetical protein